jgi:hypothetical protein
MDELLTRLTKSAAKPYCGDHKSKRAPASTRWKMRVSGLLLGLWWIIFGRQLFRFAAAQLAQKIFFRFKGPAGELALVAMIGHLIRAAVAAVAIDDS